MTETDLSREITKALEAAGCLVIRVQSGSLQLMGRRVKAAPAGTPDLCILCPGGRTVWLEIKTAAGKVSERQVEMHQRMQQLGHRVSVVRSVAEAVAACCP